MIKKIIFGILVFLFSKEAVSQSQQTKPNIIFILVDDQGYGDIGAFYQNARAAEGKPHELSPKLDNLASEGAMLMQHYDAAPVCAPSRASIMLGVSQGQANVRDNQFDKALDDNYTMASTLRQLGYSTAIIGKWGLQGAAAFDKDGASWPAKPQNRGFDYFFGYMRHSDGHEHYPKEGLYAGSKQVWDQDKDIASELDKCYTADLWTATAKKWITDHENGKDKKKPFFMYLAYETPHAVDELPTESYPAGGGLNGGIQYTGQPGHYINTAEGTPDTYIYPEYDTATYDKDSDNITRRTAWPNTYKRYATANRRIDDGVGDIMQLLKDLKIDSNTIIVYTSDNGPSIETYLGKKQRWEESHLPTFFGSYGPFDGIKRDCWEGGMRVPAIAVWPGHIPAGKIVNKPNISYDWAPTFINAAGAAVPERMDGVSLLPSLTGKGQQQNSLIYTEYYQNGKTPSFKEFSHNHRGRTRNQMQLLRVGDYLGVRYNITSPDDDFEIYNVTKDLEETDNLALDPTRKININPGESEAHISNIADLESYMKSSVLQVRRPDTSATATPQGIAERPYDSALIPSVTSNGKQVNGLSWNYYKGDFTWIPQVAPLTPVLKGHINHLDNNKAALDHKGLYLFYGYIQVPEDGKYTFYLSCDSKAFLRIHDAQIIDEDFGYVRGTEKKASVLLKTGLHPIRLYYLKSREGKPDIDIKWSGPQMNKKDIGPSLFSLEKK